MRIKAVIFIVIIIALLTGSAFYLGFNEGTKNPKEIIVQGVTNLEREDVAIDFGVFWEVWDKIKNQHIYGAETNDQDMVYGAVSGLVNSLDDPNTSFLPPDDSQKFVEDIKGSFGGIGAEIGIRNEKLLIIAPLKDSPAERVGLKPKDQILEINGESTAGITDINEAVKKIRGEVGTTVILTILREGWEEPGEISITRDIIKVPTIESEIVDGNFVHMQLFSFNERAPFVFYNAIIEAAIKGVDGIILDLRNNPGGFLEVSVDLAGWFLEKGKLVVTEEFRSGTKREFRTRGNAALLKVPTVVLVNGGSASASEILAGALRDHRDIKLIGEKTFGKGTVQELQELIDGSTLKITVAHWRLPGGLIIEKNGLEPDFEVELTEEDIENDRDPQLEKAIEVLKQEISQ